MMSFNELCDALMALCCILACFCFAFAAAIPVWESIVRFLPSQTSLRPTESTPVPPPGPVAEQPRPSRRPSDTTGTLSACVPSEVEDPFESHMRLTHPSWNWTFVYDAQSDEQQTANNGASKRSRVLKKISNLLTRGQKSRKKKGKSRQRTLAEELAACDEDWVEL